ncbi:dirigent protein 23-like [Silene latifolia]|uniref:dirigent protein 23-like n=1 Tax=Silene latifolia TaxID=37657 RepID=UPI003D772F42
MTKISLLLIQIFKFLAITVIIVGYTQAGWAEAGHVKWGETSRHNQYEHKTILQFYFHDNITGDALTAVKIAEPEDASPGVTGFGKLFMADEPLTIHPDPASKLVGRAQGMWGRSSMTDRTLFMSFTYVFFQGIYNGSSVSILGRNLVTQPIREMPVVGGTGLFRMARGYALAQTYFINTTSLNAVVGYNLTIFH